MTFADLLLSKCYQGSVITIRLIAQILYHIFMILTMLLKNTSLFSTASNNSYEKRGETIERIFSDGKEKYAIRYTPNRGLSHVSNWVKLKYAAMNLKKAGDVEMERRVIHTSSLFESGFIFTLISF